MAIVRKALLGGVYPKLINNHQVHSLAPLCRTLPHCSMSTGILVPRVVGELRNVKPAMRLTRHPTARSQTRAPVHRQSLTERQPPASAGHFAPRLRYISTRLWIESIKKRSLSVRVDYQPLSTYIPLSKAIRRRIASYRHCAQPSIDRIASG